MNIGIFVDINNLYYSIRNEYSKKLDYNALIDYCKTFGDITVARAYGSRSAFSINFDCMLRKVGFETTYKDPTPTDEGMVCDWGVGMTLEILDCADKFDILVLCSGNGDLAELIEKLDAKTIVLACNPSSRLGKSAYKVLDIPEALLCG